MKTTEVGREVMLCPTEEKTDQERGKSISIAPLFYENLEQKRRRNWKEWKPLVRDAALGYGIIN